MMFSHPAKHLTAKLKEDETNSNWNALYLIEYERE